MPWKECTGMSERGELVALVAAGESSIAALSRAFKVSRKTVYKFLRRHEAAGYAGLADQNRRPKHSPRQAPAELEAAVCAVRQEHHTWGGRKIHHYLKSQGVVSPPAPSTITGILARNGLLSPERRLQRDFQRFEAEEPNLLWQMDFKGHFATGAGRCHPLTILDDHSRFNLCLVACANEQAETVQTQLTAVFERYGLPQRMLMDNGSPWGSEQAHPHTHLTAWLIRNGVSVSHGRPYHPQTQGKEERFHRTLKEELILLHPDWQDLEAVQQDFNAWRDVYNLQRPHEALGHEPPVQRYRPSSRRPLARLEPIEYERGDEVRRVGDKGRISFRGRPLLVSRAFIGEPVGLRPSEEAEGVWDVYYCHQRVGRVDLRTPPQESEV